MAVNVHEILLENILIAMDSETFCKSLSAKIVGGRKRLEYLIQTGQIEACKPSNTQNGKWFCNAGQVLRHCRNMRTKR